MDGEAREVEKQGTCILFQLARRPADRRGQAWPWVSIELDRPATHACALLLHRARLACASTPVRMELGAR
jgi:hypothetical protein